MLEGFSSIFGAKFYGLPINTKTIVLKKSISGIIVPHTLKLGKSKVKPLYAGQPLHWYIDSL